MAKILLIETSSEVCSAAIGVDGQIIALAEDLNAQSHAALLTLQIEACTKSAGITLAELDAVALSQGPGAYTALRVGASVAKGICYALDKPLIAVDTLQALAAASVSCPVPASANPSIFAPMLDARRAEIWLALYDADLREIAPAQPLILENNSFENFVLAQTSGLPFDWIVLSGNGVEKTRNGSLFQKAVISGILQCSARHLIGLATKKFQNADFQDIAYFEPVYLKPPNITISSKPLF